MTAVAWEWAAPTDNLLLVYFADRWRLREGAREVSSSLAGSDPPLDGSRFEHTGRGGRGDSPLTSMTRPNRGQDRLGLDPLRTGPRWWRILTHGLYALLLLCVGLGATAAGGITAVSEGRTGDLESTRDEIVAALMMLGLGGAALGLGYSFARDTLALCTEGRRGAAVTHPFRGPLAWVLSCGYVAVTGLVLSSSATGVPLVVAVLIMLLPPLALLAWRLLRVRRIR